MLLPLKKPVITLQFDVDLTGTDAQDLHRPLWEIDALQSLGAHLSADDLPGLIKIVQQCLFEAPSLKKSIHDLRDQSLFNYGQAGPVIAQQLVALQKATSQKEPPRNILYCQVLIVRRLKKPMPIFKINNLI